MFQDLSQSRAETGSLHEQVDALQQKLAMEEASKKSLRHQFDKLNKTAAAEQQRNAKLEQQVRRLEGEVAMAAVKANNKERPTRGGGGGGRGAVEEDEKTTPQRADLRRRLRRALQLKAVTGPAAVFVLFCGVRRLQLQLAIHRLKDRLADEEVVLLAPPPPGAAAFSTGGNGTAEVAVKARMGDPLPALPASFADRGGALK